MRIPAQKQAFHRLKADSFHQIFSAATGEVLTYHQEEVAQLYPQEGWVEQDPSALLKSVFTCIEKTVENLRFVKYESHCLSLLDYRTTPSFCISW